MFGCYIIDGVIIMYRFIIVGIVYVFWVKYFFDIFVVSRWIVSIVINYVLVNLLLKVFIRSGIVDKEEIDKYRSI